MQSDGFSNNYVDCGKVDSSIEIEGLKTLPNFINLKDDKIEIYATNDIYEGEYKVILNFWLHDFPLP